MALNKICSVLIQARILSHPEKKKILALKKPKMETIYIEKDVVCLLLFEVTQCSIFLPSNVFSVM